MAELREGSNVVWLDVAEDGKNHEPQRRKRRRVGKLLGLQGYSSTTPVLDGSNNITQQVRTINKNFLYNAVASFLAAKHFNERRGDILPQLPDLIGDCDFYWTFEFRDGQWSALEAAKQLLQSSHILPSQSSTAATAASDAHEQPTHSQRPPSTTTNSPTNNRRTPSPITQTPHRTKPPGSTSTADWSQGFSHRPEDRQRQLLGTATTSSNLTAHEDATILQREVTEALEPFAVYGAYWSRVTKVLAMVTQGLQIPYITGGSTSAELNYYPLFSRTVPDNDADAHAAMKVYHDFFGGQVTHVACLFIQDSWGINYHASLSKYANQFGINLIAFAYEAGTIERTILSLKQADYRYVYAIMHDWKQVLRLAHQHDIIGHPDYVWIAAEEKKWTGDDFELSRHEDQDLAMALHGIGTINLYFDPVPRFERAMEEMAWSESLQQEFIDIQRGHDDTVFFDNYTFPHYDPTGFDYGIFDAVIAMGLAACSKELPLPLFTGPELQQSILQTQFEGVSGNVQFDPKTGTRLVDGVKYSLEYILLSDARSDKDYYRFQSNTVVVIGGEEEITNHHSFVFFDNTTNAPPALPPLVHEDLNLVPMGAQLFGYLLASLVILGSIVCAYWTHSKKDIFVLRAAQPFFLIQVCLGTLIMAMSVYPWSLPGASEAGASTISSSNGHDGQDADSTWGLDMACMSVLWLVFIGFAVTFSALTSKIWRINQVMSFGLSLHRGAYERIPNEENVDKFGRSLESFGACRPRNDKFYYFLGTLLVTNLLGVLAVTREAYNSQNVVPANFSDSVILARAMMSILETLMLGGPIVLVVGDNPTAFFLVGSSLVCVCCLTILLLLFAPKYRDRHRSHRMQSVISAIQVMSNRSLGSVASIKSNAKSYQSGGAQSSHSVQSCGRTNDSQNVIPNYHKNHHNDAHRNSGTSSNRSARGRMHLVR
ncbi:Gamma-aminobutyric acid (GABA) B receptor [Seminavis robusta]|uniref:Gamma-aminobutyric acid (GABA) B receptor n=1 Tax=Seminavis robusta TaxID=568900 RepID=A0A9N8DQ01_9STRA|nr:Gamma-aminobutyric acid (GABA) B receptor [Seminavis robusta]|eukprot:Sro177_g077790.1 Gamma-aminobutyric acid (GABA) B receptor (939) ;mRNA; f:57400-60309